MSVYLFVCGRLLPPVKTTCNAALKEWEEKNEEGVALADAKVVKLYCQMPPIAKLDNSLNNLKACEQLSLSTNSIDRLIPLGGMSNLKILSMGRNVLKRIEKLEELSGTLEQLWLSYNHISTLDGLAALQKLEVLYMSNNKIKEFDELTKLQGLPALRDVLFVGNPMYGDLPVPERRIEVLRRIPQVSKIDGEMVKPSEREAAGV